MRRELEARELPGALEGALLVGRLVALAAVLRLGIALLPLPSLVRAVRRAARRPLLGIPARQDEASLARAAGLAARAVRGSCLVRSLLLLWLVETRGERAVLSIGVRREASSVLAHAWIERGGVAAFEPAETRSRFAPLARLA